MARTAAAATATHCAQGILLPLLPWPMKYFIIPSRLLLWTGISFTINLQVISSPSLVGETKAVSGRDWNNIIDDNEGGTEVQLNDSGDWLVVVTFREGDNKETIIPRPIKLQNIRPFIGNQKEELEMMSDDFDKEIS